MKDQPPNQEHDTDTALKGEDRGLRGAPPEGDQVAYRRDEEVDRLGELTDTQIYQGELEAAVSDDLPSEPEAENLELLTENELRAGETGDAAVAAEEGMTYVPPIDPPVVPDLDDPQGARVAAGFGTTATDEPFDADHRSETVPADDDTETRVRDALRAHAATSRYADYLVIGTRGSTVEVRGSVEDVRDSDHVSEVIKQVDGVENVIDKLEMEGIDDEG